ncbi:MAG: peptidylprolyl isomerase [Candidatus Enteromonas sp.]
MIILHIKDYGDIQLELDHQSAPITCQNFEELVKKGFYDGLTFHRIIKGFMIQGGDPEGTGCGGSGKEILGEFKANGVNNTISHKRGVISMARSQWFNSASSQFFICDANDEFLDGQYAAFGHVVQGMEVVDKIASTKTGRNDRPLQKVVIEKAEFVA